MRNHQSIINQALLLSSSAQTVFDFLKSRATKKDEIRFEKDVDEELELALLGRKEPLIDLALAKYGAYTTTIKSLFKKSSGSDDGLKALRYSLLTNETVGTSIFGNLPSVFFDTPEEQLTYFQSVEKEELFVLFQNAKLADSFLRDFYEGDQFWLALSEEKQLATLEALVYNKRIVTPYDESFMDGYADYSYNAVFDSIWQLAEKLPVKEHFASRLCWIYDRMIGRSFSVKDPLAIAQRWVIDPTDAKEIEDEKKDNSRGYLSSFQGVRKGLALLALKNSSKSVTEFLDGSDVALRAAVYKSVGLYPDQINKGYEIDGELFFNEAVHNEKLWKVKATRDALEQVAWAIVNADEHSDLMAANIFNDIKENMAKKHPNWFIGDEETPESDEPMDSPATKTDLNQIALSITQVTTNLVQESIQKMSKRVDWICWFSLGAFVATLYKH